MAAFAPKYTAITAHTICSSVMPSIRPPRLRMTPVSPLATPSSMMSAFSVGRYRDAMDCASWKTTTAISSCRCGRRYSTSSFQSIRLQTFRPAIKWCGGQFTSGGWEWIRATKASSVRRYAGEPGIPALAHVGDHLNVAAQVGVGVPPGGQPADSGSARS